MQNDHDIGLRLSVGFSAVPNAIDDDRFPLNFKQNPVVSNTQAILGREIREPFYVSLEIIAHLLDPRKDTGLNARWQSLNVSRGSGFERRALRGWRQAFRGWRFEV
jgi:hypothetical protein